MIDLTSVRDTASNIHLLGEELGAGGQGVVYRTRDGNLAVKLVTENSAPLSDPARIAEENKRFEQVRLLPIPEGLPLAMPGLILRGHAGYVMRLLNNMIPFKKFGFTYASFDGDVTDEEIPPWLGKQSKSMAKLLVYYGKTGGLRRRLLALSQAASILARLHSRGLVYCDISDNNLFVSKAESTAPDKSPIVWFIDADNLCYDGKGPAFFTPGYGAPEVAQGQGPCSIYSDCYAFACLAFWMLTMHHPFRGKALAEENWTEVEDDWDDEGPTQKATPEQKMYLGLLPFIDDPDDRSNSYAGLSRNLFLTPALAILFEQTFCAGRRDSTSRPPALIWARAFAAAADQCIRCPECGMTYYQTEGRCPYCDAMQPPLLVVTGVKAPSQPLFVHEMVNGAIALPKRLFCGFTAADNDKPELEAAFFAEGVLTKTAASSVPLFLDGQPLPNRKRIQGAKAVLTTEYRTVTIQGGVRS